MGKYLMDDFIRHFERYLEAGWYLFGEFLYIPFLWKTIEPYIHTDGFKHLGIFLQLIQSLLKKDSIAHAKVLTEWRKVVAHLQPRDPYEDFRATM
jgi:hypothetical protein